MTEILPPTATTTSDDWAQAADAALAAFTQFYQRLTELDQQLAEFQTRLNAVAADLEADRRARRSRCE
ncbi:MAG: hypothetical protein M3460_17570 [Actinomycetota bacterium]|nr:hypothetical protein [Actinomycetota bacterium]